MTHEPDAQPVPGQKWFASYPAGAEAAAAAQAVLAERRSRFSKAVERARAEPSGKAIRKLRVATRRADVAARFALPVADAQHVKRLRRTLRTIRRAGGAVRRCEVFIGRLNDTAAAAEGQDLAHAAIALIGRLGAERSAALRRFVEQLSDSHAEADFETVQVSQLPDHSAETLVTALLRDAGGAFASVAAVPTMDFEALHTLRLRAKRLRYAAELAAPIVGEAAAARLILSVTPLQDELGRINDLSELAAEFACFHADVADLPGADRLRSGADRLLLAAASERDRRAVEFGHHRKDRIGAIASALSSMHPMPELRLADHQPRSETA